jgi:epoxide hydrolase-like predicted phosphatase
MRAITFDWGGVFTVGTFDGNATERMSVAYRVPLEGVRASYFKHVKHLEVGEWTLEHFWNVLQAETGMVADYLEFETLYLGSIRENAAMYDFFPTIPREFRVGLLSNNYPVVHEKLQVDPRWSRFDAMVFSNLIGVKKPDPVSFHKLSEAVGVPPEKSIFVDDVEENLTAARALGFSTILYSALEHDRFLQELEAWIAQGE